MIRSRRRAFLIIHVMAALSLLFVGITIAYQLSARIMKVHSHERRLSNEEAIVRHVADRVQRDVERADRATIQRDETGIHLRLVNDDTTITYTVAEKTVTRTVQIDGDRMVSAVWTPSWTQTDFRIETIGSRPRIVWMTFVTTWTYDRLPRTRKLVAAAALQRTQRP